MHTKLQILIFILTIKLSQTAILGGNKPVTRAAEKRRLSLEKQDFFKNLFEICFPQLVYEGLENRS